MPDLCIHCQRPADDHHDFQSIAMPEGCQCDPLTWAPNAPKPICEGYQGEGYNYCRRCEHNEECHRA